MTFHPAWFILVSARQHFRGVATLSTNKEQQTMLVHLYRHYSGGRLMVGRPPKGMRDVEYLGYVADVEYDGQTYRTFIPNRSFPSERLMPTPQELWAFGVE